MSSSLRHRTVCLLGEDLLVSYVQVHQFRHDVASAAHVFVLDHFFDILADVVVDPTVLVLRMSAMSGVSSGASLFRAETVSRACFKLPSLFVPL